MPAGSQTPTPTSHADELTLDIMLDRAGPIVRMTELLALLDRLFPGQTTSRWNPLDEVLRIVVRGRTFVLQTRESAVLADGVRQAIPRPLLLRQGELYLPIEAVQIVLRALGVEFDLQLPSPTPSPEPTAPPPLLGPTPRPSVAIEGVPTPVFPTPTPVLPQPTARIEDLTETPTRSLPFPLTTTTASLPIAPTPWTSSGLVETGTLGPAATPPLRVVMPAIEATPAAATPLAPDAALRRAATSELAPPQALAGRIGLTWGQLADLAHREPPQRLTVVYDVELAPLVEALTLTLQREQGMKAERVAVAGRRRDQDALEAAIARTQPQLVLDLMADPSADADAPVYVWVVHELIWAEDPAPRTDDSEPRMRFRTHEFQNLALGSLLRQALAAAYPQRRVHYDLAPLTLLARVDAPAAAVLVVPPDGAEETGRCAGALAAAIGEYVRGMRNVRF